MQYFDVLIVGAGLSGIGSAVHLSKNCPNKTYAILEARERLGGTWDLFNYPGIRSDSDMYTLGYSFKPWKEEKAIADGPSILSYLRETAHEYGVDDHILYDHKLINADWDSASARWIVTTQNGEKLSCNFLFMCSGYYKYETGYTPDFSGSEDFVGEIIHPQIWDVDLDYTDKNVVVIGSGATAVTLIPSMADATKSITMLQRSPGYMVAQPSKDWLANLLRKILPGKLAYTITRQKKIIYQSVLFKYMQRWPKMGKKMLMKRTQKALGKGHDISTDFNPRYYPWDERICLVPDGDFFKAVKNGAARVKTGLIDRFDRHGIVLQSGEHLPADLIITATGLDLQILGGAKFSVDGKDVTFGETFSYEGFMFSGVPNLANIFGYANASWTLRSDIIAGYVCRLINHMDEAGASKAVATAPRGMPAQPWFDFQPGYIRRADHLLPRQGDRAPWLHKQDYVNDKKHLATRPIDDGVMDFS